MKVIVAGDEIELGTTEAQPTIGIVDYSRRETDDFGVTTVVRRGFARRMSVRLKVPFDQVDALQRTLADLRAQAVEWVADEAFESLSFVGFYKDFSLDLATRPISFCTLTVEGLAETEAGADPGGDPAADGGVSTLQLLQPATITDSVLTAINVPEDDQPVWSAATTYPFGARVIRAHRQWESLVVANLGNEPEAGSAHWMDIGPTNRWAMFDDALGTLTEAAASIAVTLDPAAPVDAVALLDVAAATVRVQATGYDRTIAPTDAAGAAMFLDLPATDEAITITVSGAGTVSVGTLMMGSMVGLGVTEASPTAGITDYSRKETDDFGDVTVVERAWAKRMEVRALLRTDAVDMVADRIATVRARPCLWLGAADLEALSIYGFFKDFSIEVGENVSTLSLSIEGLSKAAQLAPLDSPPYLVTVFQNAADPPAPPPIDSGEVPPGWTLAPLDLAAGQYRWSTQARFLLGVQQTAWTQPVKVAGVSWQDIADDDPAHPKPEDGATVGATPEQAETIDRHTEEIEAALNDIHGLIETYGTTASAAASAAQAEAERIAAENAKTASIGARDDAEGFASAAQGSASVAHDAEVAAASSASLAANYRQDALDAAGSASADADAAEASKVAASGSSAAASTSASLSATYANQAANRAAANLVAKAEFEDGTFGTWGGSSATDQGHLAIYNDTPATFTKVARSNNRDSYEWNGANGGFIAYPKLVVGSRSFRVRGYARAAGAFACNIGLQVNASSGSTNWITGLASPAGAAGYTAFDFTITVPAGYNRVRPFVQSNGAAGAAGHDVRWVGLSIEDVTDINVVSATATTAANAAAAANTAVATITQQVSAGNPNLAPGFDNFAADWQWNYGPWLTVNDNWAGWGTHVYFDTDTPANDWAVFETKALIRIEGNAWYTLTADARYNTVGAIGHFFCQFQWYAADGVTVLGYTGAENLKNANFDFSTDGTNRRALQTTRQAPANAAFCRIRLNFWRGTGAVTQRALRQVKLERGQIATPFSQEARVYQTTAAAIDAQNRTRAYWQVNAAVPGSRAQLTVWADNAGAGVDIVGNVAISGGLLVDGTINGVKLQDLAVQTAKLANNAATVPVGVYSAGVQGFSEDVWSDVQSLTITTTGAVVQLIASFYLVVNRNGPVNNQMRLLRNGVVIYGPVTMPYAVNPSTGTAFFSGPFTSQKLDNPIAGTHTYTLQCYRDIGTMDVSERSLTAVEFKK